jgi:hypothetical protein
LGEIHLLFRRSDDVNFHHLFAAVQNPASIMDLPPFKIRLPKQLATVIA